METRANYVLVGIFTVAAVAATFLFVYWTGRFGDSSDNVPIEISIPGSAAGLDTGSRILFNGIRIGVVRSVTLDELNPEIAVARGFVDRRAPIKPSTRATISVATLSGTAEVALTGGDASEQNRLALLPDDSEEFIRIEASPSAFNDIVASTQSLLDRADIIFKSVEGLMDEGQLPLINTIKNIEKLTETFSDSSGDITALVASITTLSNTASGLSDRLEGSVVAAEELIKAVDPEQVRNIVTNVELMTSKLDRTMGDVDDIVGDAGDAVESVRASALSAQLSIEALDSARVAKIIENTERLTASAGSAAEKLDKAITSEKIDQLVDDASATIASIRKTTEGLGSAIDQEKISNVVSSIELLAGRLEAASVEFEDIAVNVSDLTLNANGLVTNVDSVMENVKGVVAAIKPEDVSNMVASVNNAVKEAENAAISVSKASEAAADLGKAISGKTPQIEIAIDQSTQLITRLNAASVRVDGILSKFDTILGSSETGNLAGSISETLDAYRRLAITLNGRVNEVATGLSQFTNNGLRDIQNLANESRTTLQRVERSVDSLARNPQRVITGGAGEIRRFEGERQRR